jgi:hypothetical protein
MAKRLISQNLEDECNYFAEPLARLLNERPVAKINPQMSTKLA